MLEKKMQGKIHIENPNYNTIYLINQNLKIKLEDLNDIKFFNSDTVNYDSDTNKIKVINSNVIDGRQKIAGKLIIESTIKYGLNKRKYPIIYLNHLIGDSQIF